MNSLIPIRKDLPPVATLRIARCKPGSTVLYQGRPRTIKHVVLRGYDLLLKLNGDEEVNLEMVQHEVEPLDVHRREHSYWPRTNKLKKS